MSSKAVGLIFWFNVKGSLRSNPSADKTINQFQEGGGGGRSANVAESDDKSHGCNFFNLPLPDWATGPIPT